MKSIHQLIPDIYSLMGGSNGITSLPPDLGVNVQNAVEASLSPRPAARLRLSGMGDKCPCQLWYSIHHPELEEQLPPYARIKYTYGHIIEHLVIALAKAAGHTVKGEQDEISLDGITGHRDCIIDGCVVDVKSSATRSFTKFKDGSIASSDSFGYLAQLDGYVLGSIDDNRVTTKDRGYLLAVDKQLGHLCLYEHKVRPLYIKERIAEYKRIIDLDVPPRCQCGTVADGKSGNIKLDVQASYNSFKHSCFPKLRTFLYASGPVYLSSVVRKPDVTEVDKHGNYVYH